MKEAFRPTQVQPELTNAKPFPRLRSGDIFMSNQDNTSEVRPVNTPDQRTNASQVESRQDQVARAWEIYNRQSPTRDINEARTLQMMREQGMPPPMGGGATTIEANADWNDTLKGEITGLNIILGSIPEADISDQRNELIEAKRRMAGLTGVPDVQRMEVAGRIQGRINDLKRREQEEQVRREEEKVRQREEEQQRRREEQEHDPEYALYNTRIREIFGNTDTQRELRSDTPDFNAESLASLRDFIDGPLLNPAEQGRRDREALIVDFAKRVSENSIMDGLDISYASRRVLFEWLLEKIISIPDATPTAHYELPGYNMSNNLASLLHASSYLESEDAIYMKELNDYRRTMHELNIALRQAEEYKKFILGALSAHGFDFVQNHLAGISTVLRLYEKSTANKLAERKEWLTEEDIKVVDDDVRELFHEETDEGMVLKDGRKLTAWEIERALRIGRIFFQASQRQSIYVGYGKVAPDTAARIGSLPQEYIGRAVLPWKMTAVRFFGGEKGSRAYMYHVFDKFKDEDYVVDENRNLSIFGLDKETMVSNSFGNPDLQSHSWRSQLLFFGNIKFRDTGETLLSFLESTARRYGDPDVDESMAGVAVAKKDKQNFLREVANVVLGQRLYLSSLVRYGNFDADLKGKLWRKIAILKPSTTVSLFPDVVVGEESVWRGLRHKLYLSEERRILNEELVKNKSEFEEEGRIFNADVITDDVKYQLRDNLINGFTEEERRLLTKIIDRGYQEATALAKINTSYNLIIDDAPFIAWEKTGAGNAGLDTSDYLRLLGSDQPNLTEGWNKLSSAVESPEAITPKLLSEAVEALAGVLGRKDAQNRVEPFIKAVCDIYSKYPSDQWIPLGEEFHRWLRKPTSEIEEYYRQSYLSWGAEEKKDFLTALTQLKAVRDNLANKEDGGTQLDRLRKETKSNQLYVFLTIARMLLLLMGAEAAYQFLKLILPEEAIKSLGFK